MTAARLIQLVSSSDTATGLASAVPGPMASSVEAGTGAAPGGLAGTGAARAGGPEGARGGAEQRAAPRHLGPDSPPVLASMTDMLFASHLPMSYSWRSVSADSAASPDACGQGGSTVFLVPLVAGHRVVAALWVAKAEAGSQAGGCSGAEAPPAQEGAGGAAGGGVTAAGATSGRPQADGEAAAGAGAFRPCHTVMSSPSFLQQLGLSVSLVLLTGDACGQLGVLSNSVYDVSTAASMQQLTRSLGATLEDHIRSMYYLESRVTIILVPDPSATVGLVLTQPDSGPVEPPQAASATQRTRFARSRTAGPDRLLGSQPVVASIMQPLASSVVGRPGGGGGASTDAGAYAGADRGGGGGGDAAPERQARLPAATELGAENEETARIRPLLLHQTLLGQMLSRRREELTFEVAVVNSDAGSSGVPQASMRAAALLVQDCVLHLQDPRRPARDLLMLMGGVGAGGGSRQRPLAAAAASAREPPSASTGAWSSPGMRGGSAMVGGIGLGGMGGNSPRRSRGGAVRSLLLLTLPGSQGEEDGCTLGLYVAFPHQLPQPLLIEAQGSLLGVAELLQPLVSAKLRELSPKIDILGVTATAASTASASAAAGPAAVYMGASAHGGRRLLHQAEPRMLVALPSVADILVDILPLAPVQLEQLEAEATVNTTPAGPDGSLAWRGGLQGSVSAGSLLLSTGIMDYAASGHVAGAQAGPFSRGSLTPPLVAHPVSVADIDLVPTGGASTGVGIAGSLRGGQFGTAPAVTDDRGLEGHGSLR
ncbi:hypothetical protein HYH03_016398 [Edaphochlamys debaryana]|uniref:Uncharacterized protein n=1 Tax=Edaphochlamys debaryana TaxID=47281 RepID=A0A835XJ99_9CHLO|nr:hypothetical protein HYH03_016398 [Edaphochlamys debaryana]|eukprot:KAG2484831.1 hypothetical protein HYH03_016398 [Edaphochlamys debaryana]